MHHKRILLSVILAVLTSMICGLVAVSFPPPALAQQPGRRSVQRWEYCAIIDLLPANAAKINFVMQKYTGVATICYFESSGCRRGEVVFVLSYADSLKLKSGADSLRDPNGEVAAALRANAASMRERNRHYQRPSPNWATVVGKWLETGEWISWAVPTMSLKQSISNVVSSHSLAPDVVGRKRRKRVSHHDWSGDAFVQTRRRVCLPPTLV